LLNFVVLQHRLLISYIPMLSQHLSRLGTFFVLFVATYIPLAIVIGRFEFMKGEVKRRPMLNPYVQDTLEATMKMNRGLLHYVNGEAEEARKEIEDSITILQRWRMEK